MLDDLAEQGAKVQFRARTCVFPEVAVGWAVTCNRYKFETLLVRE